MTPFWIEMARPFTFSGRSTRSAFWWAWTLHFSVPFGLLFVAMRAQDQSENGGQVMAIALIWYVLTLIPLPALLVRRAHDVGRPGQLELILYAVTIAIVLASVAMIAPGPSFDLLHETGAAIQTSANGDPGAELGAAAVMAPILAAFAIIDLILFVVLLGAIMFIAIPVALVIFGGMSASLLGPSQLGSNQYGPNPTEVNS